MYLLIHAGIEAILVKWVPGAREYNCYCTVCDFFTLLTFCIHMFCNIQWEVCDYKIGLFPVLHAYRSRQYVALLCRSRYT